MCLRMSSSLIFVSSCPIFVFFKQKGVTLRRDSERLLVLVWARLVGLGCVGQLYTWFRRFLGYRRKRLIEMVFLSRARFMLI